MKQKFFLSLLAISFTILSASAKTDNPATLILNAGNVEHLRIQDNIDVVLLQGADDDQSVILDQSITNKLSLKLSNNTLLIAAQGFIPAKQKVTVYVYVNNLRSITVEGDSKVKTVGALNTAKLDVFVDGDASVHLRTNGQIEAHSLNDSIVNVKYLSKKTEAKRAY
jgi:hypothetical protein